MNRMLGFVAGTCACAIAAPPAESMPKAAGAAPASNVMVFLRVGLIAAAYAGVPIGELGLQAGSPHHAPCRPPRRARVGYGAVTFSASGRTHAFSKNSFFGA